MSRIERELVNYDIVDPKKYEEMYYKIPREIYMREHWRPLIYEVIRKYCKDKNVLDLGCGIGTYTQVMNGCSKLCIGLDLSKIWLRYARDKHGDLDLARADAHNIPLKGGSLEVIVSVGLLEYVEKATVMKEVNRVLQQGGILIIAAPNKYSAYRLLIGFLTKSLGKRRIPNEPSKKEMLGLFKTNGFMLIGCRMDDRLIWLPNFLDRLIGRKVYFRLEKFFRIFGENPFSNVMLLIAQKQS